MISEDTDSFLVWNGDIFNRQEIIQKHDTDISDTDEESDTSVLSRLLFHTSTGESILTSDWLTQSITRL